MTEDQSKNRIIFVAAKGTLKLRVLKSIAAFYGHDCLIVTSSEEINQASPTKNDLLIYTPFYEPTEGSSYDINYDCKKLFITKESYENLTVKEESVKKRLNYYYIDNKNYDPKDPISLFTLSMALEKNKSIKIENFFHWGKASFEDDVNNKKTTLKNNLTTFIRQCGLNKPIKKQALGLFNFFYNTEQTHPFSMLSIIHKADSKTFGSVYNIDLSKLNKQQKIDLIDKIQNLHLPNCISHFLNANTLEIGLLINIGEANVTNENIKELVSIVVGIECLDEENDLDVKQVG